MNEILPANLQTIVNRCLHIYPRIVGMAYIIIQTVWRDKVYYNVIKGIALHCIVIPSLWRNCTVITTHRYACHVVISNPLIQ